MGSYVVKRRGRSGGGGGGRSSGGNIGFPLIMGFIIGIVTDMFYGTMGLPGYNTMAPKCAALKVGDGIQLSAWAGISIISVMLQSWTATGFSMGGMLGSLAPKILTSGGFPRYGIMNFDPSSGQISSILPRATK